MIGYHTGILILPVVSHKPCQSLGIYTIQVVFQLGKYNNMCYLFLGQQEMTPGVCVPQCANGHILVMHTCSGMRRKNPEIWKLVDGMMNFGKRLD